MNCINYHYDSYKYTNYQNGYKCDHSYSNNGAEFDARFGFAVTVVSISIFIGGCVKLLQNK